MTKYDPEEEKRIAQATEFFHKHPHSKKSKVAMQFRVPLRLWKARLSGRLPQNTKGGQNKVLSDDQEEALKQFIDFLIYLGHRADMSAIRG
jgi:hypothetical protein